MAYELLLLHKPRKKDAWQLPQGGVEGVETVEQAALRELKEEAGLEGAVIGKSECVYQYDFPTSFRSFRPDNVCGQRIEYIFALAPTDVRIQVDGREIDSYAWVDAGRLAGYIKRKEYLDLVRGLFEEAVKLVEAKRPTR
ncbi:MAG: (Di)nucleoside polyphosphate hydrolase [Candidatus Peregrinibacteria bacterium Greene0416_19]|nr:MAG: (Di)nucleoside polyphosphate hydrolase [Candidatus Peregrinibacteria bacterium Greene0416_19]